MTGQTHETRRPSIEFDDEREIVRINGIRYSYSLFDEFGIAPVGSVLRLEDRTPDGVLTVTILEYGAKKK